MHKTIRFDITGIYDSSVQVAAGIKKTAIGCPERMVRTESIGEFAIMTDWLELMGLALYGYAYPQAGGLVLAITLPLALAALLASGCYLLARSVDTGYRLSLGQLILLVAAGTFTAIAVGMWLGAASLKPVLEQILYVWKTEEYPKDRDWNSETFKQKYWAIRNLRAPDGTALEKFENYPPPEQGGNLVPLAEVQSRELWASLDASRVVEHFHLRHPVVERMLGVPARLQTELLKRDVEDFFQEFPGGNYPNERGVSKAAAYYLSVLEQRIPYLIFRIRSVLFGLTALVWLPLYVWLGFKACRNLDPVS